MVFRLRYERTRDPAWLGTYKLWVKVFALTFAMGVVSGITMSFQFGTNWPGYMNKVGNIAGPLLAYEVLTAFFLEATFLGVMLFGMNRVSGRVHVASTIIVAFGTTLSAFWILALNSWMQTPTGHVIDGRRADRGQLARGDLQPVVPLPPDAHAARLGHHRVVPGRRPLGVAAAQGAATIRRRAKTLRFGVHIAAVLVPLQIFVGDLHGLNTLKHQPAKIAAMEALWKTERGAPLTLFGIPNEKEKRNDYAIDDPERRGAHPRARCRRRAEGPRRVQGPSAGRAGVLRLPHHGRHGRADAAALLDRDVACCRKTQRPRWLLWAFAGFTFSGWVATLAGWMVTEIGRQPWLVTGILRTADAVGRRRAAPSSARASPATSLTYARCCSSPTWWCSRTSRARARRRADSPSGSAASA